MRNEYETIKESIASSGNGEGFYEHKTADNKYYYALRLSDNVKKIWLAGPFLQNKKLTAVSTGYPPAPTAVSYTHLTLPTTPYV